jgi:hypothetical protein
LTHLNRDEIPGYIEGSLINILEYDSDMLSTYGLKLAQVFKQIRDEDNEKLRQQAEELDNMFKE